jgi:hypothetical protein
MTNGLMGENIQRPYARSPSESLKWRLFLERGKNYNRTGMADCPDGGGQQG